MYKKRIIVVFIFLFTLLFLQACNKTDPFRTDYPELTDKNHLYEVVSVDRILEMIANQETGIIVLGFKTCPWCQKLVPYVNQVAKEKGYDVVYYVDIKDMRDNPESPDHQKYLQMKEAFLVAVDSERDRINSPTTIMLSNGTVYNYHLNTVSSHVRNENNILPPLTAEQETELLTILRALFIDMNE